MYRVLIVEDDRGIAESVRNAAATWGFDARCAENFRDVAGEFAAFAPHLALMDIGLPFFDGYYWCREIRRTSSVPIIFLSSASDNMNIVMAINMGGDDFIAKPFDLSVLIAKMQALLRRAYDFAPAAPETGTPRRKAGYGRAGADVRGRENPAFQERIPHSLFADGSRRQGRQP